MESFRAGLYEVHEHRAVLVDEAFASYDVENWVDRISVMEYTTLGRTGLKVSVAGLGCGGFSRLGLGTGRSEAEAVALVRQAHDLASIYSIQPQPTARRASSARRSRACRGRVS
jgi:hypothetical protein